MRADASANFEALIACAEEDLQDEGLPVFRRLAQSIIGKMVARQLIWLTVAVAVALCFSPVDAFCRHSNGNNKCEPATRLFNDRAPIKHRVNFNTPPLRDGKDPPRLILISGCPGTGKSSKCLRFCVSLMHTALTTLDTQINRNYAAFGMSLALEQGILKCISTDTIRAVMRSYVPGSISPPLHR